MKVVAYVTGHGYGHAVRAATVARALARRGAEVVILSDAHPEAFDPLPAGVTLEAARVDVGVVQHGSLAHDEAATLDAFESFVAKWPARVAADAKRLRDLDAAIVLADIAPLGVLAAASAGIPSVVVANFTWDEVYAAWADRDPRASRLAAAAAAAYGRATLLLATPLSLPMPAFARREAVPLIARRAERSRAIVRSDLGLGPDTLLVLVAFGGIGPPGLAAPTDAVGGGVAFIGYTDLGWPADVYRKVDRDRFPHPDLVGAADVVFGKPGYGTVAECAVAGTPLLWFDRPRWAEMPALIGGIENHAGGRPITPGELASGRLAAAVRSARAVPPRRGKLISVGDEICADRILALAAKGGA